MDIVIIYDDNSARRDEILKGLKSHSIDAIECYSKAKINLLIDKNKDKKIILLSWHENDLHDFGHLDTIKYSENLDLNNIIDEVLFQKGTKTDSVLDLICIGSSTGGLPVVQKILKNVNFKKTIIVVCQHIGEKFDDNIYETLSKSIKKNIKKISTRSEIFPGYVYILGGGSDYHLVSKYGKLYLNPIGISETVFHPSFDQLLFSMLHLKNLSMSCLVLSGLGNDGSKYLEDVGKKKINIIAQTPKQSVAPYMPQAAINTGFVNEVLDEGQLHDYLIKKVA